MCRAHATWAPSRMSFRLSPRVDRRRARDIRTSMGRAAQQRAGPAHSQYDRRGDRRLVQVAVRSGRGHRAVRPRHQDRLSPRPSGRWNASWCRISSSIFLEKDGTFTNAERRINGVREAIPPLAGMADWETTMALANAIGTSDELHPSKRDHGRGRRHDADFQGRVLRPARRTWLNPRGHATMGGPTGTPVMHVDHFVRGKGRFT